MPLPLEVTVNAKINLYLNVLGLREDGFHDLKMVMQSVSLADRLVIEADDGEGILFRCSQPELETADNLVVKAYFLFFDTLGMEPLPLKVMLEKHIPVQAGLGGGSADAAAMLAALQHMMGNPLRPQTLAQLGGQLGSDVPFFLTGGTAIATGRGDNIEPCLPLSPMDLVLLTPRNLSISTPMAYAKLKTLERYRSHPFEQWEGTLRTGGSQQPDYLNLLFNDFEWVIFPEHPMLATAKAQLDALGLAGALLSGSGPTLFGLMNHPDTQWAEITASFSAEH